MVFPLFSIFSQSKVPQDAKDLQDPGFSTEPSDSEKVIDLFRRGEEAAIQAVSRVIEFVDPAPEVITKPEDKPTELRRIRERLAKVNLAEAEQNARPKRDVFRIEPRGDVSDLLPDNVLNEYINLQYHITLSMIPDRNVNKLQKQIPQASDEANSEDILQLNRRIGGVTLASTGDISHNVTAIENVNVGREFASVEDAPLLVNTNPDLTLGSNVERDVSDRHYYNIKSLTLENVFSPSKNNPGQSQMVLVKISLIEPHGFRLVEDLRRLSNLIGYKNINLGRVLYRLDISFSGYNTETGEWIPRISLDPRRSVQEDSLNYFVNITTMTAKVEAKGTNYELGLTPQGHTAYRPEEIVLEAQNIATGDKKVNGGKQTFGGFLDNLKIALEKSRKTRSSDQIKRTYSFWAPDVLREQEFYNEDFLDEKGLVSKSKEPEGERVLHIGKDLTIIDIIQAALEDLPFVQDNFLADRSNDTFLVPKILWTVRYNTIYENKNVALNDYDNIRLEYIIEPYVSYKKATIENIEQARKIVDPLAQSNRVEAMLRLGMITRVYDYIHTSENTEVKDLDLNFKMLYYTAMNTNIDTPTSVGLTGGNSAANTANRRKQKNELNQPVNSSGALLQSIVDNEDPRVDSALERIFGLNRDEASGDGQNDSASPFDTKHGGMGELPKDDYGSSNSGADNPLREKYRIYFKDFTENDLIIIDSLEIRGDPIWLLSPYANIALNTLVSDISRGDQEEEVRTGLIQPHVSRVIFLKMFEPRQDDFMNPDRPPVGFGRNIFGGFYEVYKVQSTFEGGKFIQKITASKIDHLNYVELQLRNRSGSRVTEDSGLRAANADNVPSKIPINNSPPNLDTPAPSTSIDPVRVLAAASGVTPSPLPELKEI